MQQKQQAAEAAAAEAAAAFVSELKELDSKYGATFK